MQTQIHNKDERGSSSSFQKIRVYQIKYLRSSAFWNITLEPISKTPSPLRGEPVKCDRSCGPIARQAGNQGRLPWTFLRSRKRSRKGAGVRVMRQKRCGVSPLTLPSPRRGEGLWD